MRAKRVPSSIGGANHSAETPTNRVDKWLRSGIAPAGGSYVRGLLEVRDRIYSGASWMWKYQGMTARSMSVTAA